MSPSEQALLTSFLPLAGRKTSAKNQLAPPKYPYFPLQINLPELATWVARHAGSAVVANATLPLLLQFLVDQPSAKYARLRGETLAQICANMPTLLVLDGFDEVGAEIDRKMIVNVAYEMIDFLRAARTMIKVLATTRPQGYAGELAHIGVPLREQPLALLDKQQALAYAAILVAAKIPGQDEQKKAMDRLTEAAKESATQRLMATPLQVTILAALVQQLGRVPRERWNLFQRYFEYTYNREIERNTYASRLLADNKLYIVQIHTHVALLLQVEAERSGGAAARMSMAQLQDVVTTILHENGVAEAERLDLVRDIIKAAEERLVFLVKPEPNSFGFEIRSLQEFMAAWALTTGGDNEKIKARLQAVAKAAMFRNVLLFSISRLYSELSDLRLTIPDDICDSVEKDNDLARTSCAGALLALDILEEGTVLTQPNFSRALMKRALPLLASPLWLQHMALGRVTDKHTAAVVREALREIRTQSEKLAPQVVVNFFMAGLAGASSDLHRDFIAEFGDQLLGHEPLADCLNKQQEGVNAFSRAQAALSKLQSGLSSPATWFKLGLPQPCPHHAPAPIPETEIPPHPVQLTSITLQNLRGLHQIELNPAPAQSNLGQWVVILGQNGVGKTTLLRSLALALRNTQDPSIWPPGAFSNTWLRITPPGEHPLTEAQISITLSQQAAAPPTTHETLIRQNGSTSIKQFPPQTRRHIVPVFAYGCRRGSALGGAARKLDLSENEGPEIATLFDTGADIIHAETWLTKLDSAAGKDKASAAILNTVLTALCKFLDIQQIRIEANGIFITEHSGLRLPFEMLSDGYLTSAGWFLDLLARWITLAQKHHIALTPDFMQQMRGLVLIDEIDLHLHPRWQIEIISRTRELLPQMSFFVTTHNPLTLVGAKANEIWILEREDDKIVVKAGQDTPMFLTSSQIYRRYFGIEDIYPNQLGRKLQRYGFLTGFAQRNGEEQAEMMALQAVLRENGIEPDWEILPQEKPAPQPPKPRKKKARGE